jgi:lipid II:glycine glycyltransferase (peptidoglycan interpeptide bridge formation enzyme)
MDVRDITTPDVLDSFVRSQERAQFLQSYRWGEFQRTLPSRIFRMGVFDGDRVCGVAQIVERALPLGKHYWYCPRGPVVNQRLPLEQYTEAFCTLLSDLASRAEKAGAMFVRVEPPLERGRIVQRAGSAADAARGFLVSGPFEVRISAAPEDAPQDPVQY